MTRPTQTLYAGSPACAEKAHAPGFQFVPSGLDAGVLDVFRELRQEHLPVRGRRRKGFRLADGLISVVLTELQRDDGRSPQLVPDVLVRLGQLRAHPELVPPREIERRGDAEAREIGRGLRSDAPDIFNRHLVNVSQCSAKICCKTLHARAGAVSIGVHRVRRIR